MSEIKVEHIERSAHLTLSRLHWLKENGCNFSFDFDAVSAALQAKAPRWNPEYAASAASAHDGRSGNVRVETDSSAIESLLPGEVIPHILAMKTRPVGELLERAPFLGLSQNQPEKALSALKVSYENDLYAPSFWRSFLRIENRKDDEPDFTCEIVDALMLLSMDDFNAIALSASDWFEKKGPSLNADHYPKFDAMWNRFIETLHADEDANKSSLVREDRAPDWATESINSPAGNLAELMITNPPKKKFNPGEKFPKDWLTRIQDLLDLPGDSRRYALVIVGHAIPWFYSIDPAWTKKYILTALKNSSSMDLDRDAIWAGFFWNASVPQPELFNILKPQLLGMVSNQSQQRSRHLEVLAGIILAGWGIVETENERLISNPEMRKLLLKGDNEFRKHILWTLDRWSDTDIWAPQIIEFLRDVWPKQKQVRTPQISARLCELALSQKTNFPEIAGIVSGLVTKVGNDRIFIPELRTSDETVAGEHPEAMLELLHAVLPENKMQWPYGAELALKTLANKKPAIRSDPRFLELESRL